MRTRMRKHKSRKSRHKRKNYKSRRRQRGGHTITVIADSAGAANNKMNAAISEYQTKSMANIFK